MHFHPAIAPVKAAILPLTKKLREPAEELYRELIKYYNCDYDEAGQIGKRYRREDEIGTPFCITYDFESLDDKCVTVRERDSMKQERVAIDSLKAYLDEKLYF
jgi:glycyl-tRNA synthetase